MQERIQWIQHKGKKILFVDASNIRDEDNFLRILVEAEAQILAQPTGHQYLTLFY